jgi:hypothetical protein
MSLLRLIFAWLVLTPFSAAAQPSGSRISTSETGKTEWILKELMAAAPNGVRVAGSPQIRGCKYGDALLFNGSDDGIFLDQMPLEGLKKFTVEILFCPYSGGNFEQRYFHCGEVRGSRVLLELRSTKTAWYLDAFVKSADQQKTLIDSTKLHPLDKWTHIAFVVDQHQQTTYVNGIKELESQIQVEPLHGGKTSVGVRQSETSWFKGAIYQIRISPEALNPSQFLNF